MEECSIEKAVVEHAAWWRLRWESVLEGGSGLVGEGAVVLEFAEMDVYAMLLGADLVGAWACGRRRCLGGEECTHVRKGRSVARAGRPECICPSYDRRHASCAAI